MVLQLVTSPLTQVLELDINLLVGHEVDFESFYLFFFLFLIHFLSFGVTFGMLHVGGALEHI